MGYDALQAHAILQSAVSPDALDVTTTAAAVMRRAEDSEFLFGAKTHTITHLWELAAECSEPDWDGNDAAPVDPLAAQNAEAFLRALPEGIPMPELAAEPDGALSLDWMDSRQRMFSLSIGPGDRVAYAWLDGTDKGHGVARFAGVWIPKRILQGIVAIVGNGHASLRSV